MTIPKRIPYFRAATLLWGAALLVWSAGEGSVAADVLLAAWGLGLAAGWALQRALSGRTVSLPRAAAFGAGAGLLLGAALAPATLLLMAIKTGLHAHGPEYTASQIVWLWQQAAWWAIGGAAGGAGLALLAASLRRKQED